MTHINHDALLPEILTRLEKTDGRLFVAIAGPPGAGKSTTSAKLQGALNKGGDGDTPAIVVPMDGFHLDDVILNQRGLRSRKGSPPTFDFAGFEVLLERLKRGHEEEIFIPIFDRSLELSRGAAAVVRPHHRVILVEGNYVLLDREPWSKLTRLFDLTVFIDVPLPELERRLMDRWRGYGFDEEKARNHMLFNDVPNAKLVKLHSRKPDFIVTFDGQ